MKKEIDSHVVEKERGDDLVHPKPHLQPGGQQHPQQPGCGRGNAHENKSRRFRPDPVDRHAGRGNAAEDHLAFETQIPEADAESEAGGHSHQNQRRSPNEHGPQAVRIESGRDFLEQGAGRNTRDG